MIATMESKARTLALETAAEIAGTIILSFQEAKSGRVYIRDGRVHQASAPGESPAVDTEALINSVKVSRPTAGRVIRVEVSENVPYAAGLELGTSRIAPRPHMVPAFEKHRATFIRKGKRLFQP